MAVINSYTCNLVSVTLSAKMVLAEKCKYLEMSLIGGVGSLTKYAGTGFVSSASISDSLLLSAGSLATFT